MRTGPLLILILATASALSKDYRFIIHNYRGPQVIDAPVFDALGSPLEGTNYLAQLYGGATPINLASAREPFLGSIIPPTTFLIRGYFQGGSGCVAGDASGLSWLQVRAWDARLGMTYEEAVSRGLGGYGESPLFRAQGTWVGDTLGTPRALFGLQSFSLRSSQAVLMRGVRWQDGEVVVEWHPGFPRYQLQHTATLEEPWQNLGEPTTAIASTNAPTGDARFFRVVGLLD